jgi:hypothetical protein
MSNLNKSLYFGGNLVDVLPGARFALHPFLELLSSLTDTLLSTILEAAWTTLSTFTRNLSKLSSSCSPSRCSQKHHLQQMTRLSNTSDFIKLLIPCFSFITLILLRRCQLGGKDLNLHIIKEYAHKRTKTTREVVE